MNNERFNETISNSKYESLMKAISIIEEDEVANKKTVVRPNINVKMSFFKLLLIITVFMSSVILTIIAYNHFKKLIVFLLSFISLVLFVLMTTRKFIVVSILLYQKLAPEEIRQACLYEPSCSEYMLIAIDKYGVVKGVYKGVKRLLRCHQPNGGLDNP